MTFLGCGNWGNHPTQQVGAQANMMNPYQSPSSIASASGPSRFRLRPNRGELVFLAVVAVVSVFVHWAHRDIYSALKNVPGFGGTLPLMVSISTILSMVGCGIMLRSEWKRQTTIPVAAFIVSIVSADTAALLFCWWLMKTGRAPTGLCLLYTSDAADE